MKRVIAVIALLCALVLLFSASVAAAPGYDLRGMSVNELYALHDAIVNELTVIVHDADSVAGEVVCPYVVNTKTKKYHYPYCGSALQITEYRVIRECTPSELIADGYSPCGHCNP